MRAWLLPLILAAACESKPRRPPPPETRSRALEAPVPAGTVEASLSAARGELALIVRRDRTERRTVIDRRPNVLCDAALGNPGDLDACVADEVLYRLVLAGDALELRWSRAAGGPVETLERIDLRGARVVPLR